MGSGSSSESPLKKIIIGVTTTVAGAVIVYFLGFSDKGNSEFKTKRKATEEAWESLQSYEKSFKNASTNMICSRDESEIAKDIIIEYDNIISSISNIKVEKKESADNRIISLIDRRLGTLKDKKEATVAYLNKLNELDASGIMQHEIDSLVIVLQNEFDKQIASLESRDTIFMKDISADLKKKYKIDFKFTPPFLVKPEAVTGNWTLNRKIQIQIKDNFTFDWKVAGNNYSGKWTVDSLNLNFDFSDGDKVYYTITGGSDLVILMNRNSDNSFNYLCRN